MSALKNQFIHHINERRMLPFQVRWQETDYTPVFHRAIKMFKSFGKIGPVKRSIFYKVTAIGTASGATALKNQVCFKQSSLYFMTFEKPYGKKGNLVKRTDSIDLYLQGID